MNHMLSGLGAFFLLFALAACDAGDPPEQPAADPQPIAAELNGDEQVIEIAILDAGYEPRHIQLQEGVPARLIFTRHSESSCAKQVQMPDFGVEPTNVPLEEPVEITFTPDRSGDYAFVCGMEMLRGTILVQS